MGGRAVSFSCRGGAPVPAPISPNTYKIVDEEGRHGALPLQKHRFPGNETALPETGMDLDSGITILSVSFHW